MTPRASDIRPRGVIDQHSKVLWLLALDAAVCAMLILASTGAPAQQSRAGGIGATGGGGTSFGGAVVTAPYRGTLGSRSPSRDGRMHGAHRGRIRGGIFVGYPEIRVIEPDAIDDGDAPAPATPVMPLAPPRKPYVLGRSYSSLPSGCMKLIDAGISYYGCSGDWYRQGRDTGGGQYKAVAQP